MKKYDVIIVGAGIVGLTLAKLLPQSLSIAIIDQHSPQQSAIKIACRVSALNKRSQKILSAAGIWPLLPKEQLAPFEQIKVRDVSSQAEIEFNSIDIAEAYLGHIMPHTLLQNALYSALQACAHIEFFYPMQLEKIIWQDNQAELVLQNHPPLLAQLIVGADGGQSWVRQQATIALQKHSYQQQAIVTTIRTELSHQKIARQLFLNDSILAFLPLQDAHTCSIVWSADLDKADYLKNLSPEEFNAELSKTFTDLGKVESFQPLHFFPLTMQHAQNYVISRCALIGDAAHTIHPLAGQGLNLGLADAACLAAIITKTLKKNRDIGALDTLRAYQRARKSDIVLMITLMESFKRLFGTSHSAWITLRGFGLRTTQRLPLLKNYFMRRAMGLH